MRNDRKTRRRWGIPNPSKHPRMLIMAAVVLLAIASAGCTAQPATNGSSEQDPNQTSPVVVQPSEPITIRVLDMSGGKSNVFETKFVEPVRKRHPNMNIQVNTVHEQTDWKTVLDKEQPDLLFAPLTSIDTLRSGGLIIELTDWISKIKDDIIDAMVKAGQAPINIPDPVNGAEQLVDTLRVYGLMQHSSGASLHYNKDIFDKFGVPYPQAGMTWDETLELAKKLTRNEGNSMFQGIALDQTFLINTWSLSAPLLERQSGKPLFSHDRWRNWLTSLKSFYEMPGANTFNGKRDWGKSVFLQDKTIAMWIGNYMYPPVPPTTFNGGRIPMPTFQDQEPYAAALPSGHFFAVASTSKHPKEAVLAAAAVMPPPPVSDYEPDAKAVLIQHFNDVAEGKLDLNTALREAEEEVLRKQKTDQTK